MIDITNENEVKSYFEKISIGFFKSAEEGELLNLSFSGEDTCFLRLNGSKVRQTTGVEQFFVTGSVQADKKSYEFALGLSLQYEQDSKKLKQMLEQTRSVMVHLPEDPYAFTPDVVKGVDDRHTGDSIDESCCVESVCEPLADTDLAGIFMCGDVYRGMKSCRGADHWYSTKSFSFDYSLYSEKQKAVKGNYSGLKWSSAVYKENIADSQRMLSHMEKDNKKLNPGNYRAYLSPAAVNELVSMFSWGGVSEAFYRRGQSCMDSVKKGEKSFSSKFSLLENFELGHTPRFNSFGEVSPTKLSLVRAGKLENLLVSSRTAKEFNIDGNGAISDESMRSPEILGGSLETKDILRRMGTGVYINNLHYLNWSHLPTGRVTGLTRFACFWVEEGEIIQPFETMRFDDSLLDIFGENLEELTSLTEDFVSSSTYERRELGGSRVPGVLLSKFNLTL